MTGVIIGRFMPPHAGHLYLVDFARHIVDRLYVLVCTLSHEPIAGELRYEWMRELAPSCEVVHITEEIPAARRGEAGATAIWARAVRDAVPEAVTHVFASESYGWSLASELGARFVPVDPERKNIPVSASMVREDPWSVWRFIPAAVRPYYLRHVGVVDDRLRAERLAAELETVVVHPYREFWNATARTDGGSGAMGDSSIVEVAERAATTALARQANRVLIHDVRRPFDPAAFDLLLVGAGSPGTPAAGGEAVPTLDVGTATVDEVRAALTPPGEAPRVGT